jgi:4-amino-4-deoxy-L-arabinose transferase-like glycosyltransferase
MFPNRFSPMRKVLEALRPSPEALIILSLALANIVFHLLLPEYGYHRDEMYYVAIADGFSFANLDMPPVSPLFLKLFLVLFGHSLKVVHLAASLCGSLVIVFSCLIAKELGGKRYALFLTGLVLMLSGIVIFGSLYTYDDVTFVLWAAVLYLIIRMLNNASQRLWLPVGLLLGLGMLTKLTILFLGLAIFVSLWLVPERRWFKQPWIWLAALIALLCAIPYLLWQWAHGWYFLSYASTYAGRTTHASPILEFLWHQLLPNNLASVPVWLTGLIMLLFRKQWAAYRFFGYCYLILCIAVFVLGGQFYFMIPIYGVLIAAGSVGIERWLDRGVEHTRKTVVAKVATPAFYLLLSLPALPYFVPLLPVDMLVSYLQPVGVTAGIKTEDSRLRNLPQHVADRFGWEEMVREIAGVYHNAKCASMDNIGIAAGDWGEAAALHVHGRQFGLPEPISTDGWYYFDALQRNDFRKCYVVIGTSRSQLRSLFTRVDRQAVFTHPYCRPNENNNSIFLCSGPKVDLRKYWMVIHRMDPEFEDVLRRGGVDDAVTYYHRRRAQDSTLLLFTEQQLNRVGYAYLTGGKVNEALGVFKLNIEAYPESFNAYDSYGEALMADHQYELAFQNYTRSVELNPGNEDGKKKLAELRLLLTRSTNQQF